jgi:hypothetical protein
MQHCLSWPVQAVLLLHTTRMKKGNDQVRIKGAKIWVDTQMMMAREGYSQTPMHTIFLLINTVSMKAW